MSIPWTENGGHFWFGAILGGQSNTLAQLFNGDAKYVKIATTEKQNYMTTEYAGNSSTVLTEHNNLKPTQTNFNYSLDPGQIGADAAAACKAICETPGMKYNRDRRMQSGYYDCSSLVSRVYYDLGMTDFEYQRSGGGMEALNTEGLAKYFIRKKCIVLINCVDYSLMKPGDICLTCNDTTKHINYVNHALMYIGPTTDGYCFGEAVGGTLDNKWIEVDLTYNRSTGGNKKPFWIVARPSLILQDKEALTISDNEFRTNSQGIKVMIYRDAPQKAIGLS